MTNFVDRVVLHLSAGDGGSGIASVRKAKFKPLGGPDGGNGGRGGSIILSVDEQSTTLLDYHRSPHRKAKHGQPGGGDECAGADGGDMILPVPAGTVVKAVSGEVLADLVAIGQTYVAARGGRGGLGNRALSSRARKAPGFALYGDVGDTLDVVLELKSLADVALIGYPSAGKSSIVSVLSAARPKIADYPFTTLVPNLGVVVAGDQRFTVADVPGLIPGASEGKGLGLEFLRHVERCSVLVEQPCEQPQVRKTLPLVPWHPPQQGTLAVHDLVMGKGQHEVLAERVDGRKGDLLVVKPPVDRVQRDVLQRIMHPAHVPLHGKAQTSQVSRS